MIKFRSARASAVTCSHSAVQFAAFAHFEVSRAPRSTVLQSAPIAGYSGALATLTQARSPLPPPSKSARISLGRFGLGLGLEGGRVLVRGHIGARDECPDGAQSLGAASCGPTPSVRRPRMPVLPRTGTCRQVRPSARQPPSREAPVSEAGRQADFRVGGLGTAH